MLNKFRGFFANRFCCGWCSGIAVTLMTIVIFDSCEWWGFVIRVIFIVFGYFISRSLAFKYLDE